MLYQLLIMFGTALLGQIISGLLPFPFPSTIIAALILFLLLEFKIIALDKIKDISRLCNKYLAFVFVPAGVSILEYFATFTMDIWFKIFIITVFSTAATMVVTGKVSDWVISLQEKRSRGKKNA